MKILPSHRRLETGLLTASLFLLLQNNVFCTASDQVEGRHSFSLTTFDSKGKLLQVQRAMQAAAQGAPVVVAIDQDNILLAAPQVLPSVLIQDDGTSRFARLTRQLLVAHTGLSADGRVLVAAAQRMAVEHEYTFDEKIPVHIFLEEMSLLMQEYTMKPAARPFGATLIVAYLPDAASFPELYRIDPSGSVTSLGNHAVINGNSLLRAELSSQLEEVMADNNESTQNKRPKLVVELFRKALLEQATRKQQDFMPDLTILTASLSRNGRFDIKRHEGNEQD